MLLKNSHGRLVMIPITIILKNVSIVKGYVGVGPLIFLQDTECLLQSQLSRHALQNFGEVCLQILPFRGTNWTLDSLLWSEVNLKSILYKLVYYSYMYASYIKYMHIIYTIYIPASQGEVQVVLFYKFCMFSPETETYPTSISLSIY